MCPHEIVLAVRGLEDLLHVVKKYIFVFAGTGGFRWNLFSIDPWDGASQVAGVYVGRVCRSNGRLPGFCILALTKCLA